MFWIDHIGVVASDLDRSIAFYTKLFGDPSTGRSGAASTPRSWRD